MKNGGIRRFLASDGPVRERISRLRTLQQWEKELFADYPDIVHTRGDTDVVIACMHRPYNLHAIVHAYLCCPSIHRIFILGHNPEIDLHAWLPFSSPRVHVVPYPEVRCITYRLFFLAGLVSPYVIVCDEDLFLRPPQIEELIAHIHHDPTRLHGICGNLWNGQDLAEAHAGKEMEVSVLSRVYAMTDAHRKNMYYFTKKMGLAEGHPAWNLDIWDDILMSFGGIQKPMIHSIGQWMDCPTFKSNKIDRRLQMCDKDRAAFYRLLDSICRNHSAFAA